MNKPDWILAILECQKVAHSYKQDALQWFSTLLRSLFHLPPSHPAFYWRTSLVSPSSFSSSLRWTFDQVVSTEELIKMQNYLHAYEINRKPIIMMKIKHIFLTKAQTQGYLKLSIKLYCVNTLYESAVHTSVFMESNVQNDKLMGYYGRIETTPSSLLHLVQKTTDITYQDLLLLFHFSFLLLYHFTVIWH